jgi:hypothetical protein
MVSVAGICVVTALPARAVPGDVDGNTKVEANDARLVLRSAGGLLNASSAMVTAGDVAGPAGNTPDGNLSLLDAVRILRAVNGLDTLGGGTPGALAVAKLESLTVSGATTKNIQLPPGYRLTGTVKDTQGNSITLPGFPGVSGTIAFSSTSNAAAGDSDTAAVSTGAYSAVVAAGTNEASVTTSVSGITPEFQFYQYSITQTPVPASVVVNGDKVQNFVRPNLPAPGAVTGAITSPGVEIGSVNFILANGGSAFGAAADGDYNLQSGPGQGTFTLYGTLEANPDVSVTAALTDAPATVTSGGTTTRNITLATLATFHGSITAPAGLAIGSISAGNVGATGLTGYSSSFAPDPGATAYTLAVPPGSYNVLVTFDNLTVNGASLGWSYNTPYTVPAGDTTKNFALPALPGVVVLQGTVTGPDGKPVGSASVFAFGGGTSAGWHASASDTTGADGKYSLTLPNGSYTMIVSPPDPDA